MSEKVKNSNFTITPNELIDHAVHLDLSNRQFRLIVSVLRYRWGDNLPCSSNATIAKLLGVSERTIQRESVKLQEMGLLIRAKGGNNPFWDFSLLQKKAKELSISPDKIEKDSKKEVGNPDISLSRLETSKTSTLNQKIRQNKPLTQTKSAPNPDNSLSTIKDLKIKENNKPSSKVTLRANLTKKPGINFEEKLDINFNPFLKTQKQKRTKTKDTLRGKTLIQEFSEFYDNLPPEIERLTEVLAGRVVKQILLLKEDMIRSRCKVFYHRINQQALITLVLKDFPYSNIPEGSNKRKFLISTISKRAWQVVSNCLEGKAPFPLTTNGKKIVQRIVESLNNGSGYIGDPPREEAKRILRSLQNGNGDNSKSSLPEKKKPVSPAATNGEIPSDEMKRFYSSLHDKGNIEQVVRILIYKAVQLSLTAKEPGCHKVNLDAITVLVLKEFPFHDMPLVEPKRGNYLVLNVCKIVTKMLIDNENIPLEVIEPTHSESVELSLHNDNGSGHRAGDKA